MAYVSLRNSAVAWSRLSSGTELSSQGVECLLYAYMSATATNASKIDSHTQLPGSKLILHWDTESNVHILLSTLCTAQSTTRE